MLEPRSEVRGGYLPARLPVSSLTPSGSAPSSQERPPPPITFDEDAASDPAAATPCCHRRCGLLPSPSLRRRLCPSIPASVPSTPPFKQAASPRVPKNGGASGSSSFAAVRCFAQTLCLPRGKESENKQAMTYFPSCARAVAENYLPISLPSRFHTTMPVSSMQFPQCPSP